MGGGVGEREPLSSEGSQKNSRHPCSGVVRHRRASTKKYPLLSLEWPHQKTKKLIGAVIRIQESRHKVPKSVLRGVLGRTRSTIHATRRTPHGASRLVQAMSAWLVKTRRTPSRHGRDARVYGHMTTAMHKLTTRPHPPLSCVHPGAVRLKLQHVLIGNPTLPTTPTPTLPTTPTTPPLPTTPTPTPLLNQTPKPTPKPTPKTTQH